MPWFSDCTSLLGQGRYEEAERVFDGLKDSDPRALFQLAVMYYDGLGTAMDQVSHGIDSVVHSSLFGLLGFHLIINYNG